MQDHGGHARFQVARAFRAARQTFADSALTALLALDEFPDGICCQTDMMAIPLVLRLDRYGHRTPRDYSIIGFDDSAYADTVNLTTMRQDPFAMGRAAARKAVKLIAGETLEIRMRWCVPSLCSAAPTLSTAEIADFLPLFFMPPYLPF